MPFPELDDRYQKAQLWRFVRTDGYSNPIISEREEIKIRWENKAIEIVDERGIPIRVDAVVHSIEVIPINSLMWEGKASELPSDLADIKNLMQVALYRKTPDIKNRAVRRTYGLVRFKDKLPTIV